MNDQMMIKARIEREIAQEWFDSNEPDRLIAQGQATEKAKNSGAAWHMVEYWYGRFYAIQEQKAHGY